MEYRKALFQGHVCFLYSWITSESILAGEVDLSADDITAFVIGTNTDETVYKIQVLAKEIMQWLN